MARQCLVEGCGRLVKTGKAVCERHRRTPFGRIVRDELRALEEELEQLGELGEGEVSRRAAIREFRQRVERGEYAALFAGRLAAMMGEEEAGMREELTALRAALWRLMEDEEVDAVQLAHAVSRLVGTTVRARRAEMGTVRKGDGEKARGQAAALMEVLAGMEGKKRL